MIQNLSFLLKLLTSAIIIAKADGALAVSDSLSKTEIKTLFERQLNPHIVRGEFSQSKNIKDMGIEINSSGTYEIRHLSSEHFLVNWKIIKPEKMRVCIDQNKLVFFNELTAKKSTLNLSELSQNDSSGFSKLIDLLKLDPNDIFIKFNLRRLNSDSLETKKLSKFIFEPKDETNYSFSNSKIDFDTQMNIQKIILNEKNGDFLEIQFKHIKFEKIGKDQLKKDQAMAGCL